MSRIFDSASVLPDNNWSVAVIAGGVWAFLCHFFLWEILDPLVKFFSKCFHWIRWIQWQNIFVIIVKGLEPATLCARDQNANTAPTRHMWPDRIVIFVHQWFIRFTEFAEFTEFLFYLEKNPLTILTPSFDENKRHQVGGHLSLTNKLSPSCSPILGR